MDDRTNPNHPSAPERRMPEREYDKHDQSMAEPAPDRPLVDCTWADGKYRFILSSIGEACILRHGEPWPARQAGIQGDNVVLTLVQEVMRHRTLTQRIMGWSDSVFGRSKSMMRVCKRLRVELMELETELGIHGLETSAGVPEGLANIRSECADVALLLSKICTMAGGDLLQEMERKLLINQNRKWSTENGGQHIKD